MLVRALVLPHKLLPRRRDDNGEHEAENPFGYSAHISARRQSLRLKRYRPMECDNNSMPASRPRSSSGIVWFQIVEEQATDQVRGSGEGATPKGRALPR